MHYKFIKQLDSVQVQKSVNKFPHFCNSQPVTAGNGGIPEAIQSQAG